MLAYNFYFRKRTEFEKSVSFSDTEVSEKDSDVCQ